MIALASDGAKWALLGRLAAWHTALLLGLRQESPSVTAVQRKSHMKKRIGLTR